MTSASTAEAELKRSRCSRAQRSFQSPNASHLSPFWPGRKTSRSSLRMKSGRIHRGEPGPQSRARVTNIDNEISLRTGHGTAGESGAFDFAHQGAEKRNCRG